MAVDERALAERAWLATPDTFGRHLAQGSLSSPPHIRLIGWLLYLQAVGYLKRLTIALPPGHSKSTVASRWFPAWDLDRRPADRIMLASYEATLAEEHGKEVRTILRDNQSQLVVRLAEGTQAANRWQTTRGGGMWTSSAQGSITGRRASGFIEDDPFKGWEDSHSPTIRARVWNNWRSVARTRLFPGGWMCAIQCVAEGSLVPLGDGRFVPIETICPDDEVWAYSEDSFVRRRVRAARCSGEDETIVVATQRGRLCVNERHPFLIVPPDGHARRTYAPEWRRAGDLRVGDLVVRAAELPTDGKAPVPGWETPDRAWLLGFLFGDGWVTTWARRNYNRERGKHYNTRSWAVCAALGVREDLNQKVADGLEEAFGRRPKRCDGPRYWRLDCNSAGRLLDGLGLKAGKNALKKRIPEWVFGLDSEAQRAFLLGFMQADGHQPKGCYVWKIGSGNPTLVDDARRLASLCGVRASKNWTYDLTAQPPCSPAPVVGKHSSASFLWPELDARGNSLIREGEQPDDVRIERITAITSGGRRRVYDLSVEGEANFVAEGFVVHNTRWHPEDLIGHLNDVPGYVHLQLPALAETDETIVDILGAEFVERCRRDGMWLPDWHRAVGEPLWPWLIEPCQQVPDGVPWFSLEEMTEIRMEVGDLIFSGLYQQHPALLEGDMFKRHLWQKVDAAPADLLLVRCWDKAATQGGGDWTAGVLMGWSKVDKRIYILDVRRQQLDSAGVEAFIKTTAIEDRDRYGPRLVIRIEREPGSAGKDTERYYVTQVLPGFDVTFVPTTGSKETEAGNLASQQQVGNVALVRRQSDHGPETPGWFEDFIEEASSFPSQGQHDDMIDAASKAFNHLLAMARLVGKARVAKPPARPLRPAGPTGLR